MRRERAVASVFPIDKIISRSPNPIRFLSTRTIEVATLRNEKKKEKETNRRPFYLEIPKHLTNSNYKLS